MENGEIILYSFFQPLFSREVHFILCGDVGSLSSNQAIIQLWVIFSQCDISLYSFGSRLCFCIKVYVFVMAINYK
jgi:hypothetical protein